MLQDLDCVFYSPISQHFRNSPKASKVQAMVDHVDDFDYFIAVSELDALALESNLMVRDKAQVKSLNIRVWQVFQM